MMINASIERNGTIMKQGLNMKRRSLTAIATIGLGLFIAISAYAHCDTTGGPIIPEARAALEKGGVTPILKWIKADNEAEIKSAFAKAVVVRTNGPEAQELADQYFLETLIRLHRAGEGAPYSGIKDEPVEPIVAMADRALANGSVDEMAAKMSGHMALKITEQFDRAVEAAKSKDTSVEAGREYVEAYVTYMHYVEGIHAAIMSAGGHHHEGATEGAAPEVSEHTEHPD